jgi:hypothetical protein
MESIEQVAVRIVSMLCPDKTGQEWKNAVTGVYVNIEYLIDDTLKMVKNINETSLPGKDKMYRILELESKFGIPKTHLL